MNKKVQDFGGLSALLIGNKEAHPGKHLQLTSDIGDQIPHWVYGSGKDPALRTKKHSVKIKPLKLLRPYGSWNKNQGALVP